MELNFGGTPPQNTAAASDLVKSATTQTFMQDVIDASMTTPVVVCFWSPRSPASQKMIPVLERVVMQTGGKVKMVTVNADENPDLTQQLQVQAMPTVFAIKQGRPEDTLPGPQTEQALKSLVENLTDNKKMREQINAMLEAAKKALSENNVESAAQVYQHILQVDQGNPSAVAGFLRCHMALGNMAQAKAMLEQIPEDVKANPEIMAVITSLALLDEAPPADLNDCLSRLEANENDHQARYDLAMIAFGSGDPALAMRELLDIVSRDREWNEDGARKQLLKIFEALGPSDAIANAGRRKLQMMLMV